MITIKRYLSTKNSILLNLFYSGFLKKGNDNMEWYSPNKEFRFVLSRDYNQLWNTSQSQYICMIDIYNNLNIRILSIRSTELDIANILDQIVTFIDYNSSFSPQDSTYIHMNTNNTTLSNFTIHLQCNNDNFNDSSNQYQKVVFYNTDSDEYRDINFTILEYSPQYEKLIPRIHLPLALSELFDFCFHLFFEFLIDIDIPSQYQDTVNYLAEIFVGEIYPVE